MAFKFLAVAAAAVLTATVAQATDLPNKKAPPAGPLVKAAAYDWTGVYVGGSIGGAQTADDASSLSGDKLRRGVPGVYAGWNYRIADRFVVGVEADANYMGFEDQFNDGAGIVGVLASVTCISKTGKIRDFNNKCPGGWSVFDGDPPPPPQPCSIDCGFSASFSVRDLNTLRARAGYLMSNDLLAFATAGFAIAHANLSTNDDGTITEDSGYHAGWVAGGGLEYSLSKTASMKIDYLFYDLGSISDSVNEIELKGHLIRAGIATRF